MALKDDAYLDFGLVDILLTPRNDDQTEVTITNQIGGAGPFDYSSNATPDMKFKIDTGAIETKVIDVSLAADTSAVTVAELFAAINLAAPTDVTASAEAVTGRIKLAYSGAGSPTHLQIFAEAAEVCLLGQGLGTKILISNSGKSFSTTPIVKEEETFTSTLAIGIDAEVITDGYRKGVSGSFVDAANDFELRQMFEGGTIDTTTGEYSVPTSRDSKIYFKIEIFHPQYRAVSQKEAEIARYIHETIYSAKGSMGDGNHERNLTDVTYNYTATSPTLSGVPSKDSSFLPLTVPEFTALSIESIPA